MLYILKVNDDTQNSGYYYWKFLLINLLCFHPDSFSIFKYELLKLYENQVYDSEAKTNFFFFRYGFLNYYQTG